VLERLDEALAQPSPGAQHADRRSRAPCSSATAITSVSPPRTPSTDCPAAIAAMSAIRSRSTAARSKSSRPAASSIRACRSRRTDSPLPRSRRPRLVDARRVVVLADEPDAGRAAPLHLVLQAGSRAVREGRLVAGADAEGLAQQVRRPPRAVGGGVGTEGFGHAVEGLAAHEQAWPGLVGEHQVRVAGVVPELDVVAGASVRISDRSSTSASASDAQGVACIDAVRATMCPIPGRVSDRAPK
jgi:hypothetical protein